MVTQDDDDRKPSTFTKPLSSVQITDALKRSSDDGVTIILSKLAVSEIGSREAKELVDAGQYDRHNSGSLVERLALGHNRLTTLPPEFALFTKLRYLNLKHNSFTAFPDVLTLLPSLDTLDLSHNRIKSLPTYPGNLTRLQVFSLSRNKITRLPSYITQFKKLEVFQIDRNPMEWPPRAVIHSFALQDIANGKDAIQGLFNWIESDGVMGKEYDDSGYGERPEWEDERPWQFPAHDYSDATPTPHARSFSIDSNTSISSIIESSRSGVEEQSHIKLRLKDGPNYADNFGSSSSGISRDAILDNFYASSPVETTLYHGHAEQDGITHNRTTSYASTLRKSSEGSVVGKKSMPDLRKLPKSSKSTGTSPEDRLPSRIPNLSKLFIDSQLPPPIPIRHDSASSSSPHNYPSSMYPAELHAEPVTPPYVTAERNSYFHRSSMIVMNQNLPKSLLSLLDSARTILFAMGQLYQTLEHYVHQGADERLSSIFKKVLDPANVNMLHLIRSLDRFDDVSQKTVPSPAVCRGLVECCRDTVTAFRKAVGLLVLQIGLDLTDDPRYIRWLILELYATTAELSFAWQAIVPEIESLKPYLYGSIFSNGSSYITSGGSDMAGTNSEEPSAVARLRPLESGFGAVRARTARRHAGSFSSKDVEIGKDLPSYDIVPNMSGGLATHTPMLRTPKRQATAPPITSPSSSASSYPFNPTSSHTGPSTSSYTPRHLRHASQNSLFESSHVSHSSSLEYPSSHQAANMDVLRAIQGAVDLAPTAWDQIEETLSAVIRSNHELKETLGRARAVTRRLSRHASDMSDGYAEVDIRLLREDAHLFLKTIVHLSNALKAHGSSHFIPPALKHNMVKLSNFTEDFAIMLHVSSISFTSRSRPPSTYFKFAAYNTNYHVVEDNLLGSSLSRSRSAQPSLNSPPPPPITSTKSSSISKRPWLVREASVDGSDPG
uniref:RAM signaling network component n=1 Tax=Psilocybe cubensis TaxID=181762 RepID=A0A8H7Y5H7_PSICU